MASLSFLLTFLLYSDCRKLLNFSSIISDEVLSKFGYLRGNFQKHLRKIEATPSGSGGKLTPKWEYFQACSFLRPCYSTLSSIPSFELKLDEVCEGSPKELQEGEPCSTSLTPLTPSPTASEPPGDTETPVVTTNNTGMLTASQCEVTPPLAKKRKTVKNLGPVKDSLLETMNVMQSKFGKEEHFITTCVRAFMQFLPHSGPKKIEMCNKLKEEFTEEVMELIMDKMKKIHREPEQNN